MRGPRRRRHPLKGKGRRQSGLGGKGGREGREAPALVSFALLPRASQGEQVGVACGFPGVFAEGGPSLALSPPRPGATAAVKAAAAPPSQPLFYLSQFLPQRSGFFGTLWKAGSSTGAGGTSSLGLGQGCCDGRTLSPRAGKKSSSLAIGFLQRGATIANLFSHQGGKGRFRSEACGLFAT